MAKNLKELKEKEVKTTYYTLDELKTLNGNNNILRISKTQKDTLNQFNNIVSLAGYIDTKPMALKKFVDLEECPQAFKNAFELVTKWKQATDKKSDDLKIYLNIKKAEYRQGTDYEAETMKYISMILDDTVKGTLTKPVFTFLGLVYNNNDDNTIQFTLVEKKYLNKQLITSKQPIIIVVPSKNDVVTVENLENVKASKKYSALFIQLCKTFKENRIKFDTFKDYIDNCEIEMDTKNKDYQKTQSTIIKYYLDI